VYVCMVLQPEMTRDVRNDSMHEFELKESLETRKPRFYGGYKKELYCIRVLAGLNVPLYKYLGEGLHYLKAVVL